MIIDGKMVSQTIREEILDQVNQLKKDGIFPKLVVVIVGDDQASKVYVSHKEKACKQLGILSDIHNLPYDTSEQQLLDLINTLNNDENTNGILVQLPLPKHINEKNIIQKIDPIKDVDAFHHINVGKIMVGDYDFLPCTPAGIIQLLDRYNIPIEGKHCVVVGRSNIVGKPMAMLMLHRNATVTICHSKTKDLQNVIKQGDIVISAIGKAKFITADMIKEGSVVIDVGMNRDEHGKLCGDVDFEQVQSKASMITPVPGGVGPMTITTLMSNTVVATKKQND